MLIFHVNLKCGVELTNDGLIPIMLELHHLVETYTSETLDQVINAWEFFQIGQVDPPTLLDRHVDEFAPKELVLHGRMEVGIESVALSLVALLATILSILDDALPRIVNFGSIFQADGTDPIFFMLVLIITEVDLQLIEWRSLSFRSFY